MKAKDDFREVLAVVQIDGLESEDLRRPSGSVSTAARREGQRYQTNIPDPDLILESEEDVDILGMPIVALGVLHWSLHGQIISSSPARDSSPPDLHCRSRLDTFPRRTSAPNERGHSRSSSSAQTPSLLPAVLRRATSRSPSPYPVRHPQATPSSPDSGSSTPMR